MAMSIMSLYKKARIDSTLVLLSIIVLLLLIWLIKAWIAGEL